MNNFIRLIRRTKSYNWLLRLRRNTKAPTTKSGNKKATARVSLRPRGRLILFLAILIGIGAIIFGVKLGVNAYSTNFKDIYDNYTLRIGNHNVENHMIYIMETEADPQYKFLKEIYMLTTNDADGTVLLTPISADFVTFVPIVERTLSFSRIYNNALQTEANPYIAINSGVGNMLGIRTDGYIYIDEKDFSAIVENIHLFSQDLSQDYAHAQVFWSLSFLDMVKLVWRLDHIAEQVVSSYSASEFIELMNKLNNYRHIDGQALGNNYGVPQEFSFGTGYAPDMNLVDPFVARLLQDKIILAEQVKVEVFNSTPTGGLAGRMSRILTNYGVNVVRYANAPKPLEKTTLYIRKGIEAPANTELIRGLLNEKLEVVSGEYEYNSTGDIVLVLGADISVF